MHLKIFITLHYFVLNCLIFAYKKNFLHLMIFDIYYNFMSSSTSNSNLSIIFSKSIFRKIFVSFTLVAGLHPTSDDTS